MAVADVAAAREIHRVGTGFLKSPWYWHLNAGGVSNMFNTTDPKKHNARRRLLAGPMSSSALRAVEPMIDARVRLAIKRMQEEMETRNAVDIFKWWRFLTTDVIGEMSFGESFQMLERGKVCRGCLYLKSMF